VNAHYETFFAQVSVKPKRSQALYAQEKTSQGQMFRAGASSQGRMHNAFQVSRHGAKSCRTGKLIVARRGCAMLFTALWLTDARPELFPVMIW